MKKIYIAGCGGMLGDAFYKNFKNTYTLRCTDIDVNADWLSYLDFRDKSSYVADVKKFQPDYLFHLGAHTDLEYCEENPDDAYLTNTIAVENAVHIANDLDIPLLYISTAGIFDGKKDSYDDWDTPNPLGIYGRSKYLGEEFVKNHSKRYLICRAGWMMGGGPQKDKKFINKILSQIRENVKNLYIVNDKDGTPTYTHDFAQNVEILLESELWGLYNMVCAGHTSRLEVAKEVLKILNREQSISITEVTSEYFIETYSASRPPSERLVDMKLSLRDMNIMRDWRISLKEYLSAEYADLIKE